MPTKQQVDEALECMKSIMDKMPRAKKMELVGEFNTVCLLLEKLRREAK